MTSLREMIFRLGIALALAAVLPVRGQEQTLPRTPTLPGIPSAAFPYAQPEEVGLSPGALKMLADQVASWVASEDLVGAEILIVKQRKIVLHEAVGWSDRESGVPLERGAIHRIASATKPVTGTAILLLVEEGKVTLDDRISDHLASFDNEVSRHITIRQLMTHTGGFGVQTYPKDTKLYPSLRALVDDIGRSGPQHPPGAFIYSDLGTNTLGAVVEVVSGQPLERFLNDRILEPLGMRDTHGRFAADAPWTNRLASAYVWWSDVGKLAKFSDRHIEWRPPFLMPAWGLYTTAMDYARFLRVWLDRGQHGDSRLFSTATAQAALTQDVEPLYAMQWETWGRSANGKMPLIFGHGGATGPKAWVVPDEDLMIVFFTQAARHSCVEQLSMLAGRLGISQTLGDHTLYGRWRAPASKVDPSIDVLTPQQRERYVGWYDVAGRVARVWVDQGVLALTRDLRGPPGGAQWNDLDADAIPCGSESPPWKTVHLISLGDHEFAQGRYVDGRLAEVYWPDVRLTFAVQDGEVTGYEVPYAVVKETASRYRLRKPALPFAPVPLPPEQRSRYLGVYAVTEVPWAFRLLDRNGQLFADWAGSLEHLDYGGGNLFKNSEREIFYFFALGPDGNARDVTLRVEDGSVVTARRYEENLSTAASADSLLITGVVIVDAATDTISAPRDILLAGGKIIEVAEAGTIAASRATRVLPAEGMFAMPGLIDVHAHIGDGGLGEQSQLDREGALAQFVRYGVTTIFAPGGGGGNDDQLARWKERCRTGELLCPGVYGSGALITAPGSHPIGTIWNLPDDVDPAVVYQRGGVAVAEDEPVGPLLDRKVALGADAVKIIIEDWGGERPRLSDAKIAELVRASHQRSLKTFAHVSLPAHVEAAVKGGVDGVMHSAEEAIPDAVLAEMARRQVFYVATLALYDRFFDIAHGRFEQEPYATAGVSQRALASLEGFRGTPFETPEQARPIEVAVRDNLLRAAAAGVPLALGTDVNNPHVFPGYSVHEELALMVEAGLTPAQALEAATVGGASFLGKERTLGKIAPGYEADLIILCQNPLDDVLNTRTLESIIHDGRVVDDVVSTSRHHDRRHQEGNP